MVRGGARKRPCFEAVRGRRPHFEAVRGTEAQRHREVHRGRVRAPASAERNGRVHSAGVARASPPDCTPGEGNPGDLNTWRVQEGSSGPVTCTTHDTTPGIARPSVAPSAARPQSVQINGVAPGRCSLAPPCPGKWGRVMHPQREEPLFKSPEHHRRAGRSPTRQSLPPLSDLCASEPLCRVPPRVTTGPRATTGRPPLYCTRHSPMAALQLIEVVSPFLTRTLATSTGCSPGKVTMRSYLPGGTTPGIL